MLCFFYFLHVTLLLKDIALKLLLKDTDNLYICLIEEHVPKFLYILKKINQSVKKYYNNGRLD